MARTREAIRITKKAVDAAAPEATRYELWDSDLKGFGLRVEPTGAKSFIVRYRPGAGGRAAPKRFVSVGRYGTLTPDEARRKARELLGAAANGKDPAANRDRQRMAVKLGTLIDAFMSQHVETKRKPATASLYRHLLQNYVKPELGARRAEEVTKADLLRLHHKLNDRPFLANRVIAAVGSMYSWASQAGQVPEEFNPAARIEKYAEDRRERFLSTDEIERLGAALRQAETAGIPWEPNVAKPTSKHAPKAKNRVILMSPYAAAAIRLLLLTGARLREILHLRWDEVDLDRGLLLLPDSKTGRKTIILNAPAMAIIDALPRAGQFVIAGEKPNKPRADLKRPWDAVCRKAGLSGVRLHDLRHTHASFGAGAGLGLPILGKLLGHTQASTTQRYAHLDADPLRRASDRIGGTISAALEGKASSPVVALDRKRRNL